MQLSPKDKSLILFIVSVLIVLWVVFSVFSKLFFTAAFQVSDIKKITSKDSPKWFNVARDLKNSDLKNRVILLDFWSHSCLSCIKNIPNLHKIQNDFGAKVAIISVHSGIFKNEQNSSSIRKAILKYNIETPVIDDSNLSIYKGFKIKSLPSFILINPRGNIVKTYDSKDSFKKLRKDIKKLISKYRFEINREPLPIALEKDNIVANILSFPTKLEYAREFLYEGSNAPAIFISNSGANNIIISNMAGNIIAKIGGKYGGFVDGKLQEAAFKFPSGLLYNKGKLYVSDTGNHALRVVDFVKSEVSTLVGSGASGAIVKGNKIDANDVDLSSPTDIKFFPDNKHIVIANSGSNQILSYDLKNNEISVIAGDGNLGMKDGKYPNNSLAQTYGLSTYGDKLYFVDSKSSSLRVINKNGEVKSLIGKGLQNFGHKNGTKDEALMQNPLSLIADDTGVYICDSFNNKIRKYDFATNSLSDVSQGKLSGEKFSFDEPSSIISVVDRFFIADTNNNRIIILRRGSSSAEIFNIMPPLKLSKERLAQYLPNLKIGKEVNLKANKEIFLNIEFSKGWKINEKGPSFINLLEVVDEKNATLVVNFNWDDILQKQLKLPELKVGHNYMLQGVVYYCEDKKDALCYVKSYEQKISVSANNKLSRIDLVVDKTGLSVKKEK